MRSAVCTLPTNSPSSVQPFQSCVFHQALAGWSETISKRGKFWWPVSSWVTEIGNGKGKGCELQAIRTLVSQDTWLLPPSSLSSSWVVRKNHGYTGISWLVTRPLLLKLCLLSMQRAGASWSTFQMNSCLVSWWILTDWSTLPSVGPALPSSTTLQVLNTHEIKPAGQELKHLRWMLPHL